MKSMKGNAHRFILLVAIAITLTCWYCELHSGRNLPSTPSPKQVCSPGMVQIVGEMLHASILAVSFTKTEGVSTFSFSLLPNLEVSLVLVFNLKLASINFGLFLVLALPKCISS